MTTPRLPRDDLAAALKARRELGPDYDDAFVEAVAERLQQAAAHGPAGPYEQQRLAFERQNAIGERKVTVTVACVSLGVAIPLTGIAGGIAGLPGLFLAWIGLVIINLAYALRPRHH